MTIPLAFLVVGLCVLSGILTIDYLFPRSKP